MIEMIKKTKKNLISFDSEENRAKKGKKVCYFELLFRQKFDSDRVQNIFYLFSACYCTKNENIFGQINVKTPSIIAKMNIKFLILVI